jgi:hypothetical protein
VYYFPFDQSWQSEQMIQGTHSGMEELDSPEKVWMLGKGVDKEFFYMEQVYICYFPVIVSVQQYRIAN